jgi:salicylate hydroxylase
MMVQDSSGTSIAIVGAGIGGLVLALALRERGFHAELFEQSSELSEIGAAVALSANATRELDRLGLLSSLSEVSAEPEELIWRDGRTGSRVAAHPVGKDNAYRARFGAPYFGIHRAGLQKILSSAHGQEGVNLSHRLVAIAEDADGVLLTFENGRTHRATLVIGADGVRSAVRRLVWGRAQTVYSGTSAFRGIVPRSALPSLPDGASIQFWMGPDAHLLHYAIGGAGEDINFFAVVEGPADWPLQDRWIAPASPGEALAAFRGWHPAVTEMVGAGWVDRRWGLFVVQQPLRWWRGRVALLGDAAHGMLPHQGQGANTTIEDALVLAELLARSGPREHERLFQAYEGLRRTRTRAIQRSSWATNRLLHLGDQDPAIDPRNARMAGFPEHFGWIHSYDATAAAKPRN